MVRTTVAVVLLATLATALAQTSPGPRIGFGRQVGGRTTFGHTRFRSLDRFQGTSPGSLRGRLPGVRSSTAGVAARRGSSERFGSGNVEFNTFLGRDGGLSRFQGQRIFALEPLGSIVDDDGVFRADCAYTELRRIWCQDDVLVADGLLTQFARAAFQGLPIYEAEAVGNVVDDDGLDRVGCLVDELGNVGCLDVVRDPDFLGQGNLSLSRSRSSLAARRSAVTRRTRVDRGLRRLGAPRSSTVSGRSSRQGFNRLRRR
ncbi:MAG: hypothetical protein HY335_01345 [Deinococcus sp.]|nr:hypothetical protein [Deinococcus sp.]